MSDSFKPIKYRKGRGMNTCQYNGCENKGKFLISNKVIVCQAHYNMFIQKSNTGWNERWAKEILGI
jgi:hypothetical protein